MGAISLWFFIYEAINKKRNFIFRLVTTLFFPIGFLQFFWPNLCFLPDSPMYRKFSLLGLNAEFVEAAIGPFAYLLIFLLTFTITYLFVNLLIYYIKNKRGDMFLFFTSSSFFFASIVIDSLISADKINFIYTSEYSYVALILVMDYSLLKKFLTLQKELSMTNVKLEEQVKIRTREIKDLLDEIKKKNRELCVKIDETEAAKNSLLTTNTFLENIMHSMNDVLIVTDIDGTIVKINREGLNFLMSKSCNKELKEEDFIGKKLAAYFPEDKYLDDYILKSSNMGKVVANYEIKCKTGDIETPFSLTASSFKNSDGKITGSILILRDITNLKELENNLRFLATHDTLTMLPNRLLLTDRANQAISQALRYHYYVAIMLMDFDHFKEINDTLGHHVGDELLKEAAKRIQKCLRDYDTVGRMGGDEFVVVLGDLKEEEEAEIIGRRILKAFEEKFIIGGKEIRFSPSIGISLFPVDGDNIEILLKEADIAMYTAKNEGGNRYCYFSNGMKKTVEERVALKDELRNALEKEEFEVYYQPLVDINTGKITSCEALARWNHPDFGLVEPLRFIGVAESIGLIIPLGEMIMRKAVAECSKWQQDGFLIGVSVNISVKQLEDKNFVDKVKRILEESGLPPEYLMLEITEKIILSNNNELYACVLKELREIGVEIYIDDFGNGISYFKILKQLPISALKIDRLFTQHIDQDGTDAALVRSIIALSKCMNLKVILEGIESNGQLECVKSFREKEDGILSCDQYQGYLFSKPVPPAEIRKLLKINMGDS